MGVNMGEVMAMAGAGADGVYTFIRRDQEKPNENGIHIETTRDLAGVRDGMFTTTVIRNAGTESDPEIVIDHKLMDVSPAVASDPEKRHEAARVFFRTMTDNVEAALKSGASKIVLNAAGNARGEGSKRREIDGNSFRGYTIWPRMGFDAPIPFNLKNKLPEGLDHCRTLLDLHATPAGTRWWRDNGTDIDVQLDLSRADSPQMQVFGRFARHFERDRRELAYGTGDGWLSPADQAKLDELWEGIWDEGLLDDYSGEEESRAFCPTGEGGGIDNSCSASDSSSGSEWAAASTSPPKEGTADWGQTSGTEIWTPAKPLFKGSDRVASIRINRAAEVREIAEEFGLGIAEVTDASGPVSESTERAHITLPRVEVGPTGNGIQISWTCRGATTGDGYAPHEKPFAEPKDTVVNAVSAYRVIDRSPTSGLTLTLGSFDIHPDFQGKGIALEMTGRVVSSPVDAIIMTAARQDDPNPRMRMTGYAEWAKHGYNAHINSVKAVLQAKGVDLPDEFGHCRSLLDLYATPGGPEFWREHGDTITLRFDKRPRSQSYNALFATQDRVRRKNRMEEPWTRPATGSDCDYDPEIDAAWAEIQSNGGLDGLPPEEPEDGDPREVQPH
jgi:GNAT superfamily N-acetyltransferase